MENEQLTCEQCKYFVVERRIDNGNKGFCKRGSDPHLSVKSHWPACKLFEERKK